MTTFGEARQAEELAQIVHLVESAVASERRELREKVEGLKGFDTWDGVPRSDVLALLQEDDVASSSTRSQSEEHDPAVGEKWPPVGHPGWTDFQPQDDE